MAHAHENEIKCPYCDYVFSDSWEHNDDDGCEIDCGDCGEEFTIGVCVDVTYSSYKIACCEKNPPADHDYDDPEFLDFTQSTCDQWNAENFSGRSDHTPYRHWDRKCKNCDDKEYGKSELDGENPFK